MINNKETTTVTTTKKDNLIIILVNLVVWDNSRIAKRVRIAFTL